VNTSLPPVADEAGASPMPDTERITWAWRKLRRGAAIGAYKDILFEGLDHAQIDALDTLSEGGEMRMTELANALRVERSTATRAVDRLEALHFARRRSVHRRGMGRAVLVSLTEAGRETHRVVAARRQMLTDRIVSDFTESEVHLLADLFHRLIAGYDRVIAEAQEPTTPDGEPT
jgi:DNA-binding MarR family transcriptional regulator